MRVLHLGKRRLGVVLKDLKDLTNANYLFKRLAACFGQREKKKFFFSHTRNWLRGADVLLRFALNHLAFIS